MSGAPRRIALYGGTFDPPHVAHVLASTYVLTTQPIDEIWWIPVFNHAFSSKAEIAPFEERIALCERATHLLGPRAQVIPIERELGGINRSIDTTRHLMKTYPDCSFRLVIGTDILAETHLWKDFELLAELAPPIVLGRRGYPAPKSMRVSPALPNINSSEIRSRLRRGVSASDLLPTSVEQYILEHGLYGAKRSS